jgi:hypothetical protein
MDTQLYEPLPCFHCLKTRAKIEDERAEAHRRFPQYPAPICCTPDCEYRCPRCNGLDIDFAMHYASGADDATCELAQCLKCGWVGEATEAAPPVQPWAELEAVALRDETRPEDRGYPLPTMPPELLRPFQPGMEDDHEMARRLGEYREVA